MRAPLVDAAGGQPLGRGAGAARLPGGWSRGSGVPGVPDRCCSQRSPDLGHLGACWDALVPTSGCTVELQEGCPALGTCPPLPPSFVPGCGWLQRAVELQESWRIMVEFSMQGGPGGAYQDHKDICETWKLRTPNDWEPLRWWGGWGGWAACHGCAGGGGYLVFATHPGSWGGGLRRPYSWHAAPHTLPPCPGLPLPWLPRPHRWSDLLSWRNMVYNLTIRQFGALQVTLVPFLFFLSFFLVSFKTPHDGRAACGACMTVPTACLHFTTSWQEHTPALVQGPRRSLN